MWAVVFDNGIGMRPELFARCFKMFVKAERTSEQAAGGLGIGPRFCRRTRPLSSSLQRQSGLSRQITSPVEKFAVSAATRLVMSTI